MVKAPPCPPRRANRRPRLRPQPPTKIPKSPPMSSAMRNVRATRDATTIGDVRKPTAMAGDRAVPVSADPAASVPWVVPASAVPDVVRARVPAAMTIRTAGHDLRGADRAATGGPPLPEGTGPVTDSVVPVSSPGLMIEDRRARRASIVLIVPTSRTADALRAGPGVDAPDSAPPRLSA